MFEHYELSQYRAPDPLVPTPYWDEVYMTRVVWHLAIKADVAAGWPDDRRGHYARHINAGRCAIYLLKQQTPQHGHPCQQCQQHMTRCMWLFWDLPYCFQCFYSWLLQDNRFENHLPHGMWLRSPRLARSSRATQPWPTPRTQSPLQLAMRWHFCTQQRLISRRRQP